MCGIIGCVGNNTVMTVITGMKRMEYRGYDSYGFCAFKDTSKFLYKDVGLVSRNTSLNGYAHTLKDYTSAIGHTRWATHGEVSRENAHPQHDEQETIFVVHNGTVDNSPSDVLDTQYIVQQLKLRLIKHWMTVKSSEDYLLAVNAVTQKLEGDNAFLVSFSNLPDCIFCATKGSKSLLITDNGYVSSDSYAIAGMSKEALRINNSVACLSSKGIVSIVKPFNSSAKVETVPENQDGELSEPHFMLQEIKEQYSLMKDLCNHGAYVPPFRPERLNLIGCGSSYHAAMWAKVWFETIARIPTIVTYGSEAFNLTLKDPNVTNIYISQSGETKDTIRASHDAKSDDVYIVTNNINSQLGNSFFNTIDIGAGIERGVAATKTFTLTCYALWELAWRWTSEGTRNKILDTPDKCMDGLADGIKHVLDREEAIRTLAKMIAQYDNALFLGRHWDYPIALEGALKLKEVSYIHAEGMPAAEMKHGPLALVDEKTPSIFIANGSFDIDTIISNMREVKSRNGKVFAVTCPANYDKVKKVADWTFQTYNTCNVAMKPLVANVVLQLLAYHVAVEKELNPDRPRNLAKSVTV
jgi:glucosamine--fructose-6-phosphate aminotransferase (isomerizing)